MKLACVVHRFGADIAGGSEAHARQIAEHLAARHDVTILTTCARDHISWRNEHPEGASTLGRLRVERFAVSRPRSLHRFADASELAFSGAASERQQEEWFEENGPDAPGLIEHLRVQGRTYDAVLFWAFRYAEVYFGLPLVEDRAILVPTAEDDPVMRMPVVGSFFARPRGMVYLTPEERALVERRIAGPPPPSVVVGAGLDPAPAAPGRSLAELGLREPFVLYLGRVDPNKGCADLFRHFIRYADEHGGGMPLVLAGPANMPIPDHASIRSLGFVDETTRETLLRHAALLVMPSRYESLSLVLLEAWNHGVPALVNGHCAVLKGQALRANGGIYYRNYDEFARGLSLLASDPDLARQLGRQGLAYVDREYRWPVVLARIEELLWQVVSGA